MASRRQEKVARVIKESVSDIIANRLNDPRIDGFVSITEVFVTPDLRNADVSLSIMSPNEKAAERTFMAIEHAGSYIQGELGHAITTRYCPKLHFRLDTRLKKTMDVLRLIDEVSREYHDRDEGESAETENT